MEREGRNKRPYCSICAGIGKLCLTLAAGTFEDGEFPLGHGQRCWYRSLPLQDRLVRGAEQEKREVMLRKGCIQGNTEGSGTWGQSLAPQRGTGVAVSAGHSEQCQRRRPRG